MTQPSYITAPNGHKLAYHQHIPACPTKPGIVFLGGFKSDMEGSKALFLESWCKENDHSFVRFDYFGHGSSEGEFIDGTIGQWKDDVLTILCELTKGPQIVVGSSLGGWLMLLAALKAPEKFAGLIGVAAAPDFTETLMWNVFSQETKTEIMDKGFYALPNDYCPDPLADPEPYIITRKLIEEARNHLLLSAKNSAININKPAIFLQGMNDVDVPYPTAMQIAQAMVSDDVELIFQKKGDHRMSSPESLQLLENAILQLMRKI